MIFPDHCLEAVSRTQSRKRNPNRAHILLEIKKARQVQGDQHSLNLHERTVKRKEVIAQRAHQKYTMGVLTFLVE